MFPKSVTVRVEDASGKQETFSYELQPTEAHLVGLLSSALGEEVGNSANAAGLLFHCGLIQMGRVAAEMNLAHGFVREEAIFAALGIPQAQQPALKSRNGGGRKR